MITWPALPGWAVSTVQEGQLPWTRDHEHTGRVFSHCKSSLPGKPMFTKVTEKPRSFVPLSFLLKGKKVSYSTTASTEFYCIADFPNMKKCLNIQYSECSFLKIIFFLNCKAKCFSESLEWVRVFSDLISITGFKLQGKNQMKEFNVVRSKRLACFLESFFLNIFLF